MNSQPKNRVLLIFLMSLAPNGLSKKKLDERKSDYMLSIQQTQRLLGGDPSKIIYCENTLGSESNLLDHDLGRLLKDDAILVLPSNSGNVNKGVGELDMAAEVVAKFRNIVLDYDVICYMSGRHIPTNEMIFNISINLDCSAFISNPDFVYLDGKVIESEKSKNLNDMFFAMKTKIFLGYVDFFLEQRKAMIEENLNSESLLFNYIGSNDLDVETAQSFGLLRRETVRKFKFLEVSIWHLC